MPSIWESIFGKKNAEEQPQDIYKTLAQGPREDPSLVLGPREDVQYKNQLPFMQDIKRKQEAKRIAEAPNIDVSPVPTTIVRQQVANESDIANKQRANELARGLLDPSVVASGNTEAITEALRREALKAAEDISTEKYPIVPGIQQFSKGFATGLESLGRGATKIVNPVYEALGLPTIKDAQTLSSKSRMDEAMEALSILAPDVASKTQGDIDLSYDLKPVALAAGQMTPDILSSFVPAVGASRLVRALPAIQKLRTSGSAGKIFLANILENEAANISVNYSLGQLHGQSMDQISRSIAANPSSLLPFSSNRQFVYGAVADYIAGRATGMDEYNALLNAGTGLVGNIGARFQVKDDLHRAFLSKVKNGADAIYAYRQSNPTDIQGALKMTDQFYKSMDKEAKLLYQKPKEKFSAEGEKRLAGLKTTEGRLPSKETPAQKKEAVRSGVVDLVDMLTGRKANVSKAELGPEFSNAEGNANAVMDLVKDTKLRSALQILTGKRGYVALEEADPASMPSLFEKMRTKLEPGSPALDKLNSLARSFNDDMNVDHFHDTLLQNINEAKNPTRKKLSYSEAAALLDSAEKQGLISSTDQVTPGTSVADARAILLGQKIERPITATSDAEYIGTKVNPEEPIPYVQDKLGKDQVFEDAPLRDKQFVEKHFSQSLKESIPTMEDVSNTSKSFKDAERIFESTFSKYPKLWSEFKEKIWHPFLDGKKYLIQERAHIIEEVKKNVIDAGIKRGSKESAFLQMYGEKNITMDEMVKEVGKKMADKIVDADKFFREKYEYLIDFMNEARKQIYPNDPSKLVPHRKDYYHHFQEMAEGFEALNNIIGGPAAISPDLAGISEFTKPKSRFLGLAKRRETNITAVDAVGGFLNYADSALYAAHVDPTIGKFRAFADTIAKLTDKNPKMNGMINYLHSYANDLANKTNPFDRVVADFIPGGRTTLKVLNWLSHRVAANTITGSAYSGISQVFNFPQVVGAAKTYLAPGFARTLAGIWKDGPAIKQSGFIAERYANSSRNMFREGMLHKTVEAAKWINRAGDELVTKLAWNSMYEKALREGISEPVRFADAETRKLVGGRGIGENPLALKSQVVQFIIPFQREVINAWHMQKDFINKKDLGGLAMFFMASYLMNEASERTRGSRVVYDPINALIDGITSIDRRDGLPEQVTKFIGRQAGEVISNIPGGSLIASQYPEFGNKVLPTRKEFFGNSDPTRFGGGVLASKSLTDPLFFLLPPAGGAQIKRTYKGLADYFHGAIRDKKGKNVKIIDKNIENLIRAAAFGPYGMKEGVQYSRQKGNKPDILKILGITK